MNFQRNFSKTHTYSAFWVDQPAIWEWYMYWELAMQTVWRFKKLLCPILSLKWAFLIACRLSVCRFFTFSSSLPVSRGRFQPKLAQCILLVNRIQVCSNEGTCYFPMGDDNEIAKILWLNLKILFSRTTEPNSTKLGT